MFKTKTTTLEEFRVYQEVFTTTGTALRLISVHASRLGALYDISIAKDNAPVALVGATSRYRIERFIAPV